MFTYAVARDPSVAGYAMVSDRFLAVLAADAGDDGAQRLWQALSGDEPTLASVLSMLAASGMPSLPSFALVELVDAVTRTVALAVRGDAGIALADDDVRTGGGVATWRESAATAVTGLTLRLRDAPDTARPGRLPLGRGVVRADSLEWGVPLPAPAAETAAPVDPPIDTVQRERMPVTVDDRTELRRSRRTAAGRPVLRLGPDRILELDLPVVFGRSPRPAAHPGARLVPLSSPRREISGAHLEVRWDGDALVARDLDSTNGTILQEPDGSTRLLRHGAAARLVPGVTLDFGDGAVAVLALASDGAG